MTTCLLRANSAGEILDAEGKVIGKVVPVEPSRTLVDTGAQALAMFENYSVWPDSWDPVQVRQMRSDAKKAYRAMVHAATVDLSGAVVRVPKRTECDPFEHTRLRDRAHGWNACLDALGVK